MDYKINIKFYKGKSVVHDTQKTGENYTLGDAITWVYNHRDNFAEENIKSITIKQTN